MVLKRTWGPGPRRLPCLDTEEEDAAAVAELVQMSAAKSTAVAAAAVSTGR